MGNALDADKVFGEMLPQQKLETIHLPRRICLQKPSADIAGHMLSDVGSLALSLIAMRFAAKPRTPQMTYGYYRGEILAALVNGAARHSAGAHVGRN